MAQRKINSMGQTIKNSVNISSGASGKSRFGVSVDSFLKNIGTPVAKDEVDLSAYKEGVKVKHKRFGIGTIKKVEPEDDDLKVEIVFENGQMKRLMAKFANLEIVG